MSLLLNLLNYSTLSYRQSTILSPKQDERSRSTLNIKKNDFNNQKTHKFVSKSMQKDCHIDPKIRMFHRLNHLISKKCKKHYYTLFVTLQTIKKKKLYLNQHGQFDTLKPQIQIVQASTIDKSHQKQTKIKIKNEIKIQQRMSVIHKLQQIQNLYLVKQFQSSIKHQFFNLLKINSTYKQKINILEIKVNSFLAKNIKKNAYKKLNLYNNFVFKIQLLTNLLKNLVKKYQIQQIKLRQNNLNNAFNKILKLIYQKQKQQQYIKPPVYQDYLTPVKKVKMQQQSIQTVKKALTFQDIVLIQTQINKIKVKPAMKLSFLQNLVQKNQTLSFYENKQSIKKHLNVTTNLNQQSLIFQNKQVQQEKSLICHKLNINKLIDDHPDQYGQNIFDQNKTNIFYRSNRFKQSRVISLKTNRIDKNLWKNINHQIKNNQYQNKIQNIDISQVSAISIQKSYKSSSTLIQECNKLNFSAFGGQAVNFKNSLVKERQMLHENQKIFQKKIFQKDNNQILLHNFQPLKDINFNFKKNHQNILSNNQFSIPKSILKDVNSNSALNYCLEDNLLQNRSQFNKFKKDNSTDLIVKQNKKIFFRNKSQDGINNITIATVGDRVNKPKCFIKLVNNRAN